MEKLLDVEKTDTNQEPKLTEDQTKEKEQADSITRERIRLEREARQKKEAEKHKQQQGILEQYCRNMLAEENQRRKKYMDECWKEVSEKQDQLRTEASSEINEVKEIQNTIRGGTEDFYQKSNETYGQTAFRYIASVLPVSIFKMCSCSSEQTHRPLTDAPTQYGINGDYKRGEVRRTV